MRGASGMAESVITQVTADPLPPGAAHAHLNAISIALNESSSNASSTHSLQGTLLTHPLSEQSSFTKDARARKKRAGWQQQVAQRTAKENEMGEMEMQSRVCGTQIDAAASSFDFIQFNLTSEPFCLSKLLHNS